MGVAILTIGTATERINLLNPGGIHLLDWQPLAQPTEGTFSQSPLADFRQMVNRRDLTAQEEMTVHIKAIDHDDMARKTAQLRKMLRYAEEYWFTHDHDDDPVYLEAKAACETNTRYAVVYSGGLPQDANHYAGSMLNKTPVMRDLSLVIERGAWLDNLPGTGTAIKMSASTSYDGRTLGRDTATTDAIYVASKWNEANITDIWYWDNSAVAWNAANLMDAAFPFPFMPPAPLQVNDFVLFGIDSTLADSGPFCSLVFDIATALGVGGGITIQWRYSTGFDDVSLWNTLTALVQDNTNASGAMTGDAFDTTGINSVHWSQPIGWTAHNPRFQANPQLGVTAYWVCAYVTAAAGNPTPPTQQNRDIYTVTWPYVEVDDSEVGGDFGALVKGVFQGQAGSDVISTDVAHELWVGLYDTARSPNFRSYINFADEQNYSSGTGEVAIQLGAAVEGTVAWDSDTSAPTGRCISYTGGGGAAVAENISMGTILIYGDAAPAYNGQFLAFVRAKCDTSLPGGGAITDARLAIYYGYYGASWPRWSDYVAFSAANVDELFPFGVLDLRIANSLPGEELVFFLTVQADVVAAAGAHISIYDLVLIPVDEWAAHLYLDMASSRTELDYDSYLTFDDITVPKVMRALVYGPNPIGGMPSPAIRGFWAVEKNVSHPFLWPGRTQRLHFLETQINNSATNRYGNHEAAMSVQFWKTQRYLSMRGSS